MDTLDAITVNTLGLFCDIVGAALLFWFGLPADIRRDGRSFLCLEGEDESTKKSAHFYDLLGRTGFILLMAGFLLQILSNYM